MSAIQCGSLSHLAADEANLESAQPVTALLASSRCVHGVPRHGHSVLPDCQQAHKPRLIATLNGSVRTSGRLCILWVGEYAPPHFSSARHRSTARFGAASATMMKDLGLARNLYALYSLAGRGGLDFSSVQRLVLKEG